MMLRAYTRDMEGVLSLVLLVGVLTSFVLILVGFVLSYVGTGSPLTHPIISRNFLQFAVQEISLAAGGKWEARTFVTLGLLTLMLTPYVRVLSSAVLFARRRDFKYTAITLFVLGVLTASLALV